MVGYLSEMEESGSEMDPQFSKRESKRFEILDILMGHGADIDSIYSIESGNTILLHLCTKEAAEKYEFEGIKKMVYYLLKNGSNRFIKNKKGMDCMNLLEDNPRKNNLRYVLVGTQRTHYLSEKSTM